MDLEQIELNCNIGFFTLESSLSEIMSGLWISFKDIIILYVYDRIVLTFIPLLLTNMENFLPEVTSNSNSAVLSTVAMDYRVWNLTHYYFLHPRNRYDIVNQTSHHQCLFVYMLSAILWMNPLCFWHYPPWNKYLI